MEHKPLSQYSLDELLNESLSREASLLAFYEEASVCVGYELKPVIFRFLEEEQERMQRIQKLQDEIHEMRELTGAIAG